MLKKKEKSTPKLYPFERKSIQLLKAFYKFMIAKEMDRRKRKNELDYIDYFQLGIPLDKQQ